MKRFCTIGLASFFLSCCGVIDASRNSSTRDINFDNFTKYKPLSELPESASPKLIIEQLYEQRIQFGDGPLRTSIVKSSDGTYYTTQNDFGLIRTLFDAGSDGLVESEEYGSIESLGVFQTDIYLSHSGFPIGDYRFK